MDGINIFEASLPLRFECFLTGFWTHFDMKQSASDCTDNVLVDAGLPIHITACAHHLIGYRCIQVGKFVDTFQVFGCYGIDKRVSKLMPKNILQPSQIAEVGDSPAFTNGTDNTEKVSYTFVTRDAGAPKPPW